MGVTLSEPRLESKKHRRQSRKKVNQSLLDDLDELDDDDDDDEYLEDNPIIRAMEQENLQDIEDEAFEQGDDDDILLCLDCFEDIEGEEKF